MKRTNSGPLPIFNVKRSREPITSFVYDHKKRAPTNPSSNLQAGPSHGYQSLLQKNGCPPYVLSKDPQNCYLQSNLGYPLQESKTVHQAYSESNSVYPNQLPPYQCQQSTSGYQHTSNQQHFRQEFENYPGQRPVPTYRQEFQHYLQEAQGPPIQSSYKEQTPRRSNQPSDSLTAHSHTPVIHDHPSQKQVKSDQETGKFTTSKQNEKSICFITATAKGIQHWSSCVRSGKLLCEVFGTLQLPLCPKTGKVQMFTLITSDGSLRCIYYEMDQAFPHVVGSQEAIRCVGELQTNGTFLCVTVRLSRPKEYQSSKAMVVICNKALSQLVAHTSED